MDKDNKELVPAKKSRSFADFLRYHFKKSVEIKDSKDRIKAVSLAKLNKMKDNEIKTIAYNEPGVITSDSDIDISRFSSLEELILGNKVTGITTRLSPTLKAFTFESSEFVLPKDVLTSHSLKTITTPTYSVSIPPINGSGKDSYYLDKNNNLNIEKSGHISLGQSDHFASRGIPLASVTKSNLAYLANKLLDNSKETNPNNPVAVYSDTIGSETNYGIHAVVNSSGKPFEHTDELSPENLVALQLTGNKIDLSNYDTNKFPNLSHIVISPKSIGVILPKEFIRTTQDLDKSYTYVNSSDNRSLHISSSTKILEPIQTEKEPTKEPEIVPTKNQATPKHPSHSKEDDDDEPSL